MLERLQQEFLAITSHELRHPLADIKGQAQLIRRREKYSERSIDTIIDQTNQLGRLIDDLLLASLIEADRFDVHLEPTDVVNEVRLAVEQMENEEHPIRVDVPATSLIVLGDRQRLRQVFANLLTNAMKYSSDKSEIAVRVTTNGDTACIDVIDQGVGIAPEVIPQLFGRFYRAQGTAHRMPGLGLGLYITHRIVHAHGGSINVQSEVGAGSTFTVTLPLHAVSAR